MLLARVAFFQTFITFSSYLFLNVHLIPITLVSFSLGTKYYTLFLVNWYNSNPHVVWYLSYISQSFLHMFWLQLGGIE